jgi:hypothetical protein
MPDVQKTKTITQQLVEFFVSNKDNKSLTDQFDVLKFGEIKIEVKDGQIYRALVSSSVIIKKGDNNATK